MGFEIRSISGRARPTVLSLGFGGRLDTLLNQIQVAGQFHDRSGECAHGGPSYTDAVATVTDSLVAVTVMPWAFSLGAFGWPEDQYLPSGEDEEASVRLRMDLLDSIGSFEIDTACVSGSTLLQWVDAAWPPGAVVPSFQKGIIVVAECSCMYHGDLNASSTIDAVDVGMLINWVYFSSGPPASDATCPHVDRGDVNCDGVDDAADVAYLVEYVNFGGDPPCDPCTCDPYPESCP